MRLLFIGTGEIGIPTMRWILESGKHQLAGLITQPDKPAGRHQTLQPPPIKQLAESYHLPMLQPVKIASSEAIQWIKDKKADVIVVMAYGQFLPPSVWREGGRMACLNLHASLLPRHRGAAPIQAAIEAGDEESGITVMYVDAGLDTGDILLEKSIPIQPRETGGTLHDRLAQLAPEALAEALDLLEKGCAPRVAQDTSLASQARKLTRESGEIDWSAAAVAIDRKIRAMNPWPAAYTFIQTHEGDAKKLKIFSAELVSQGFGRPGEIRRADKQGMLVVAGEGGILLQEVQLEGRKRMSAADFLLGHSLAEGSVLG